jgi:predicted RND superfamily exporter protein
MVLNGLSEFIGFAALIAGKLGKLTEFSILLTFGKKLFFVIEFLSYFF